MQTILISDTTLQQAQSVAGTALSFKESLEIAKLIDRLHPHAIELPPMKSGVAADALLVKSIASAVRHAKLVLSVPLTEADVEAGAQALRDAKQPCICIHAPLSTVQMEYRCHKKPAAMLELIDRLVKKAASLGVEVVFSAGDATRAEPVFLSEALQTAVAAGATTVTVCDTAGVMLPDELGAFVRSLQERTGALSGVTLGIQCSDALHLSAGCAVAAMREGARLVRTTLPEAGLTRLNALAAILRARGMDLGLSTALSTTELTRIETQVDWILHARRNAATPYDGGSPRQTDDTLRLDASSTRREVAEAVERLGYDLSEEDDAKVFEAFGRIAARKTVGEKELDAIVASAALQVPPAYTLESYVINSGNVITATAHVRLNRNGRTLQGLACGDGPIDAAFLAVEQLIGHHYELDDFQIQAITEGREAMGSALVRLRSGGRLYAGKGISTDVIGASIHAYINALNKIVYEEMRV